MEALESLLTGLDDGDLMLVSSEVHLIYKCFRA